MGEVISKADSWRMFDDISAKYDYLNRLLSLGLDKNWRKNLLVHLPNRIHLTALDLATGTADVPLLLAYNSFQIDSISGIDLSEKMLKHGEFKVKVAGLQDKIALAHGDAAQIPFADESFDVVTIAFGIRNTESPQKVLSEMFRVLKKNGRALILEFSLPHDPLLRSLGILYLRSVVPFLGGLIAHNYRAYKYLNRTIENFPCGEAFCKLMEDAGFNIVRGHPLTFGVATIYQGDKI